MPLVISKLMKSGNFVCLVKRKLQEKMQGRQHYLRKTDNRHKIIWQFQKLLPKEDYIYLSALCVAISLLLVNYSPFVAQAYHFGILTSLMHNAWMRTVCGRLKNDYDIRRALFTTTSRGRKSQAKSKKQAIEIAAQVVLDARAQFPESTLANLYDPLTMPPVLLKAHQHLDKTVDAAYGKTNFQTEAQRVRFYLNCTRKYTSLFAPEKPNGVQEAET